MKIMLQEELGYTFQALRSPLLYAFASVALAFTAATNAGVVTAPPACWAVFLMILLAWVDYHHGILPHSLNLVLAGSGLLLAPLALGLPVWQSLAGIAAFYGIFLIMGTLAGQVARQRALGGGDLNFVAAMGAWLGLSGLPPFLLATAVAGLGVVGLRLVGRWREGAVYPATFAFGPVLACAGFLTMVFQSLYWRCMSSLMA